ANTCVAATGGFYVDWNDPNTWTSCGGTVPQAGDSVEINNWTTVRIGDYTINPVVNIVIGSADTAGSGSLVIGNNNAQTITGTLTINDWSYLYHDVNPGSTADYIIDLTAANINVTANGTVEVDARGYEGVTDVSATGSGPGGGGGGATGGGAGHGGAGGAGNAGGAGGSSYCNTSGVILMGSSGGRSEETFSMGSGAGGGLIRLTATGTFTIDGTISADGESVSASSSDGAGAGGGIHLIGDVFTGTPAAITAVGGDGGSGFGAGGGGAGAGGCVNVEYITSNTITSATVTGGTGMSGGGNGSDGVFLAEVYSTNTAPTVAINSAAQKTDGTGTVDISVEVDDADDDDTVRLKVEYSAGETCSGGGDPTLDTTPTSITADFGSPGVSNTPPYQVGTTGSYITTSSGSNTVQFDWSSATNLPTGDGTYCIKITPSDGTDTGTAATQTLTIDNVDPSGLTALSSSGDTTSTESLAWSIPTETNFDHYEIWFGTDQAAVQGRTVTATEWDNIDDTNLALPTVSSTTVTGLSPNVGYYYKIWAVDDYGNEETVTDQRIYTSANVPGTPTVAASATTAILVTIDQNSNPNDTVYAFKVGDQFVQSDGSVGGSPAWQSYSTWGGSSGQTVTGLSANTQYAVIVKAKNGDNDETSFSSSSSKYTYASPVTGVSLADATSASAYGLSLSWTDAGQSGVKVDLSSVSAAACDDTYDVSDYDSATLNATSPRLISASANTCYKARIGSYNGDGVLNTTDYATTSGGVSTPPAQPTDLALSRADAIELVWDWTDVTGATNYKVYRSSDDALIGETGSSSSLYSQTAVSDGGAAVSPNTQYTVYVRAVNGNGTGISSSTASGYTYASTPTSLSHDFATQTTDTMKWTWVSGGDQKEFYANMLSPVTNSGWITDLFWTVSSVLSPNTQYTFYVKARNAEDTETTTSSSASAYTAQGTPTGITFSAVAADSITVTATGTFANLTSGSSGIRFQNSSTSADNTFQTASWTNSSLSPNIQYTYVVSALNGDGDETSSVTDTQYTLANVPGAVTVDNPSTTTLDVTISVNSNPATTEFAIHETGTDQYVQTDGTLGESAVWQTVGTATGKWGENTAESGKVSVSGLSLDTSYEFEVKARNADNTETAYGTASSAYTSVGAASAPTVDGASTSTLDVTINEGSNPSTTTYKIYETVTGLYVQTDGTLAASAVWQTAAAWGSVSGVSGKITVTNLSPDRQYTFVVTPKNSGGTESSASSAVTASTSAETSFGGGGGVLSLGGGGGGLSTGTTDVAGEDNDSQDSHDAESEEDSSTDSLEFVDVKGHWAEEYVQRLTALGVIATTLSKEFKPDEVFTRAELVKVIINVFHIVGKTYSKSSFIDVKSDYWALNFIETAKEKGVISGYPDKTFKPESGIQRVELLKIVFEAAGIDVKAKVLTKKSGFKDVDPKAWYMPYLDYAFSEGIVKGYPDGTFKPGNPVSRAEASKIILGVYDLVSG
ncbi:S-layer homology domain-containing protein, partial [Candidatus Peregrinibacteria bacterium]|nr:S-layer homology domain-containing protein [Candidatus Peregrinibacteria bacterium]